MVFTEPLSVWHLYFPELNGETFEMDKKSPSTSGWVEGVLMFTKNLVFTQLIGGSKLPFCEESEEKHPILTSCPSYSMMVWFGYWVGINNADEHSQLVPENECPSFHPRLNRQGQSPKKNRTRSPSLWAYHYNSEQEQILYPFDNRFCHWGLLLSSSWWNNHISTNSERFKMTFENQFRWKSSVNSGTYVF